MASCTLRACIFLNVPFAACGPFPRGFVFSLSKTPSQSLHLVRYHPECLLSLLPNVQRLNTLYMWVLYEYTTFLEPTRKAVESFLPGEKISVNSRSSERPSCSETVLDVANNKEAQCATESCSDFYWPLTWSRSSAGQSLLSGLKLFLQVAKIKWLNDNSGFQKSTSSTDNLPTSPTYRRPKEDGGWPWG